MFDYFLKFTFHATSDVSALFQMPETRLWVLFFCVFLLSTHSAGIAANGLHSGRTSNGKQPSQHKADFAISHQEVPARSLATNYNATTATLQSVTAAMHVAAKTGYETAKQQEELLGDTLFVREFVLALDVVEREPVDIVTSYTMPDARAWCFARIHNSEKMQDLYFEWYYEDTLYFEMSTKTGLSNNWRTYSSVGLQPGTWRVLLKNNNGKVLEEIQFLVSE